MNSPYMCAKLILAVRGVVTEATLDVLYLLMNYFNVIDKTSLVTGGVVADATMERFQLEMNCPNVHHKLVLGN